MPARDRDSRTIPTLYMYVGLPASGKSTEARRRVLAADPGAAVRLNKDDARAQLHAGRWSGKTTEKQIVAARNALVVQFLTDGVDVHVDDTNLAPFHQDTLAALAFETNSNFEVVDFTDVPVAECVRRDAARPEPVGQAVIARMARQMGDFPIRNTGLGRPVPAPGFDPDLPSVVLCDIDGTLAHMGERGPYDWKLVGSDTPNTAVVSLVQGLLAAGKTVVAFSGRDGVCRDETAAWLSEHVGDGLELHLRTAGDSRRDSVVKHEMFHEHIAGRYNVEFVIDDRDQVVRTWRNMGLTCVQVAPGAF